MGARRQDDRDDLIVPEPGISYGEVAHRLLVTVALCGAIGSSAISAISRRRSERTYSLAPGAAQFTLALAYGSAGLTGDLLRT